MNFQDIKDFGKVNGFNIPHICPEEVENKEIEDGETICTEDRLKLSTNPGEKHEMEEFASAVSVN